MQNTNNDKIIWPFLLEVVFLIWTAFEVYIFFTPTNVLNTKDWYLFINSFEIYMHLAWLVGSIHIGVLGIILAKSTGKLRIPTIIASIANIIPSGYMLAMFVLIFIGAMLGQIHV